MSSINTDKSTELNITTKADHHFHLELSHFENDETTPKQLVGTYKMTVAKDKAGTVPVLELTQGAGLTINEHVLIIDITKTQNNIKPTEYYYGIRVDYEDGKSDPAYYGTYILNPNVPKP